MKTFFLLFACSLAGQVFSVEQIQYERAKSVKRDKERGMNYAKFVVDQFHYLNVSQVVSSVQVTSVKQCGLACANIVSCFSFNVAAFADVNQKLWCELLATDKYNSSDKLQANQLSHHYSIYSPCSKQPCENGAKCIALYEDDDFKCECLLGFEGKKCEHTMDPPTSCDDLRHLQMANTDGVYSVAMNGNRFDVYCDITSNDKTWTLAARFSNNDDKNWMKDDGNNWYDKESAAGRTTDPADNIDMISPAFWSVNGTEFKITRSDDSSHTALLYTTGECLNGQTFRSKVTSYGDFRNGEVWASDSCLGACDVQYGGQYLSTAGFSMAECDGDIQTRGKIGFWCDWSSGDGAVLMIGGGGSNCDRADHGIGVTNANAANFQSSGKENDFGSDANSHEDSYSLNLWVR